MEQELSGDFKRSVRSAKERLVLNLFCSLEKSTRLKVYFTRKHAGLTQSARQKSVRSKHCLLKVLISYFVRKSVLGFDVNFVERGVFGSVCFGQLKPEEERA